MVPSKFDELAHLVLTSFIHLMAQFTKPFIIATGSSSGRALHQLADPRHIDTDPTADHRFVAAFNFAPISTKPINQSNQRHSL